VCVWRGGGGALIVLHGTPCCFMYPQKFLRGLRYIAEIIIEIAGENCLL
jgi:hypothetical protein